MSVPSGPEGEREPKRHTEAGDPPRSGRRACRTRRRWHGGGRRRGRDRARDPLPLFRDPRIALTGARDGRERGGGATIGGGEPRPGGRGGGDRARDPRPGRGWRALRRSAAGTPP